MRRLTGVVIVVCDTHECDGEERKQKENRLIQGNGEKETRWILRAKAFGRRETRCFLSCETKTEKRVKNRDEFIADRRRKREEEREGARKKRGKRGVDEKSRRQGKSRRREGRRKPQLWPKQASQNPKSQQTPKEKEGGAAAEEEKERPSYCGSCGNAAQRNTIAVTGVAANTATVATVAVCQ
jgi:hypothetical protein